MKSTFCSVLGRFFTEQKQPSFQWISCEICWVMWLCAIPWLPTIRVPFPLSYDTCIWETFHRRAAAHALGGNLSPRAVTLPLIPADKILEAIDLPIRNLWPYGMVKTTSEENEPFKFLNTVDQWRIQPPHLTHINMGYHVLLSETCPGKIQHMCACIYLS